VDALGGSCSEKGSASLGQSMYTACVYGFIIYTYMYVCMYIYTDAAGAPGLTIWVVPVVERVARL